jgi:transposase
LEALEKGYRTILGKVESDKQQQMFAQEVLKNLQRSLYGKSSEKRPVNLNPPPTATKPKKKRERSGPTDQPRLAVQEIIHTLPEEERVCDRVECRAKLNEWPGQFEESERIEVVPPKFFLGMHRRQKYRCECGECIKTARGPVQLKEGSRYSPEFGVEAGINKYEHHLPLERQVKMMKQGGLIVESQTLFKQVDTIAWYLKPHVYEKIAARVRGSSCAAADETPWENLGKDAKKGFYLWGAESKDAVFFQIADSRSSGVAAKLLKGFSGVLMCDGFSGYNPIASEKLVLAHCWSHVRRKFVASENVFPVEAAAMITLIGRLYDIERDLKKENASVDEVRAARGRLSKPITAEIYQKLWDLKMHLPQSSIGKAVDYTLKLWRGLTVFLDYAPVPLDNNGMEREIRGPVTGRKNHHGSNSLKTADVAAVWYTVIHSCKLNGVDAKEYINATLGAILKGEPLLMPWEWAVSKTTLCETAVVAPKKVGQIVRIAASEAVS